MSLVLSMLRRSLDKGRYRATVQFETVRKMRLVYSNIWHASKYTLTTSVMVRDLKKTLVTSCPSYSLWFKRFVQGMHKRIGDEVYQDQEITLEVVHRLVNNLEKDYRDSVGNEKREHIANQAVFILAVLLMAIRGEEVFKLNLCEIRKFFLESSRNMKEPHIVLPSRGRFKSETGESFHFVSVTSKSNSGLQESLSASLSSSIDGISMTSDDPGDGIVEGYSEIAS